MIRIKWLLLSVYRSGSWELELQTSNMHLKKLEEKKAEICSISKCKNKLIREAMKLKPDWEKELQISQT